MTVLLQVMGKVNTGMCRITVLEVNKIHPRVNDKMPCLAVGFNHEEPGAGDLLQDPPVNGERQNVHKVEDREVANNVIYPPRVTTFEFAPTQRSMTIRDDERMSHLQTSEILSKTQKHVIKDQSKSSKRTEMSNLYFHGKVQFLPIIPAAMVRVDEVHLHQNKTKKGNETAT